MRRRHLLLFALAACVGPDDEPPADPVDPPTCEACEVCDDPVAPGPFDTDAFEEALPFVVRTYPPAGATSVPPGSTQLEVTFSRDMDPNGWAYVTTGFASTPSVAGDARWESARVNVLPVELAPNTLYAVFLNSGPYLGFYDLEGNASVEYLLVFETGP